LAVRGWRHGSLAVELAGALARERRTFPFFVGNLSVVSGQLHLNLIGGCTTTGEMMAKSNFENLAVYKLSEEVADRIWDVVAGWQNFAKDTVGKQLVRAADSIGANIAEGTGRGTYQENRRFVRIARASLNETKHWLRRAYQRKLLSDSETNQLKPLIDELAPRLNAYLRSIGTERQQLQPTKATDN
jgi:four helix bundle protein